jgi:putative ABC transport system permease protein
MTLKIAFRALGRNKLRSFLTMLGIIIGVGAVITMVSIGEGAKALVRDQIASLGTNVLIVFPGSFTQGGARSGAGGRSTLTEGDARAIVNEAPGVALVSPTLRRNEQIVASNQNWQTVVQGVAPEFQQIRKWELAEGRFISQTDVERVEKVALIGQTVAANLFGHGERLDAVIRVRNIPFRVVGVLAGKGQSSQGSDQDDVVMIPYTTMQKRVLSITFVHSIMVSTFRADQNAQVQEAIAALLRERHRLQPDQDDDFSIRNLSDVAEAASATANVMAVLLGSIASVSLLVGGIGIMNIMLVSVTERTREIGIRMAVGARSRDILFQFVVEAVVMAAIGGALGILIGIGSSNLIHWTMKWPILIRPDIAVIALLVSGGVGVFFGLYPAQKAARLDPIEALRYE